MLRHFREVHEFIEAEADGPIRTFLGEISRDAEARERLN